MGGAETFLMNIYRNIDKKDFKFYFLCFKEEKFFYEDEIKKLGGVIIRIPPMKFLQMRKHILEISKIIKTYNIDVVHVHTFYNSIFSLIAAKKSNVSKRIVHAHTIRSDKGVIGKIYALISKILIQHYANVQLACSKEAGEALYLNKEYQIVKNGIDINKFFFNENKRMQLREKLNISKETVVLGNVARFLEEKNHKFLIDIFYEYHKMNSNSKLLLIGDGPIREEIYNRVKNYHLENDVIFLGVRKDANDLYNIMDIFIFPSLYEGLGIVLIEAQTNGLKCLVSNTVPKEAKISDNIEYYDLSNTAENWAKKVQDTDKRRNMLNTREYDIINTVKKIEMIYKE